VSPQLHVQQSAVQVQGALQYAQPQYAVLGVTYGGTPAGAAYAGTHMTAATAGASATPSLATQAGGQLGQAGGQLVGQAGGQLLGPASSGTSGVIPFPKLNPQQQPATSVMHQPSMYGSQHQAYAAQPASVQKLAPATAAAVASGVGMSEQGDDLDGLMGLLMGDA
jgi:hypothetical protein